jgi:hypothetical protein
MLSPQAVQNTLSIAIFSPYFLLDLMLSATLSAPDWAKQRIRRRAARSIPQDEKNCCLGLRG